MSGQVLSGTILPNIESKSSSPAPGTVRLPFAVRLQVKPLFPAPLRGFSLTVRAELCHTLGGKFATGCLVLDEGNAVNTADGLQVKRRRRQTSTCP